MKFVMITMNPGLRFVAVAALLLMSQQSMAAGTAAGSTISNQARVDYSVGTVGQEFILSDPAGNSTPGAGQGASTDFVVDNRVDFTIVANPTPVVPTLASVGDFNVLVQFIVENTGNQTQDYALLAVNEADGVDVNGFIDSGQMNNIRVIADNNGNGILDDADAFIDELAPDVTRVVWILADTDTAAPNALLDGDIANMLLTATTHNSGAAGLGGVTVNSATPDDPNTEDVVLAVANVVGNGSGSAQNTYQLQSAALTITKATSLIGDPFTIPGPPPVGYTGPFHIPGATVRYVISVENMSATTAAASVQIDDTLLDVALVAGATITIDNGGAPSTCTADLGDVDVDGCGLTQVTATEQLLEVGNASASYSIAGSATLTITFDTTIL